MAAYYPLREEEATFASLLMGVGIEFTGNIFF
jgi:hypothetical protein